MTDARPARPWLAALLVLAITGTFALLWQELVEDASAHCGSEEFCGLGEGLLMIYVGLPVATVLCGVALRTAGARSALLGTGWLVLWGLLLVNVLESLEPPAFAWPGILAAVAALWFPCDARIAAEAD